MSVVDEYLNTLEGPEKAALEHISMLVKQTAPEAEQVITYGMPGFKYKGKYLISFAAFKAHMSIFPGAEAIEAFKADLAKYKTSKGTIQFTLEQPLSDTLVKKIIKNGLDRINRR